MRAKNSNCKIGKTPKAFFDNTGFSKSRVLTTQQRQSCLASFDQITPPTSGQIMNHSLPLDSKFGNENKNPNFYENIDFSLGGMDKDRGHELSSNWKTPHFNSSVLSHAPNSSIPGLSYQNNSFMDKSMNVNYSQGNLESKLNKKSFMEERDLRQSSSWNSITNQITQTTPQPSVKTAKRYVSSVLRKRILLCMLFAAFIEVGLIYVNFGISHFGWYNLAMTLLYRWLLVWANWKYFSNPSVCCVDSLQFIHKLFNLFKANDFHFMLIVVYFGQSWLGNCYLAAYYEKQHIHSTNVLQTNFTYWFMKCCTFLTIWMIFIDKVSQTIIPELINTKITFFCRIFIKKLPTTLRRYTFFKIAIFCVSI